MTFELEIPTSEEDIFITGNQASLGDWNPRKVILNKTSPNKRSITLQISSPAEFKFTRGSLATEAVIEG